MGIPLKFMTEDDDDGKKPRPADKDRWDKANIILRSLGGILTAGVIVFFGFLTQDILEDQKDKENDVRLYTQLMSERERAEQSLRTTMFKEIFDRVLSRKSDSEAGKKNVKPDDQGKPGENGKGQKQAESVYDKALKKELRIIKTHVVGIDMISRNFHEFLDMKPLFLHAMWEIIVQRGNEEKRMGSEKFNEECSSVGESWSTAKPCQELLWQQKQLVRIANRVVNKQFNVLAENGRTIDMVIPFDKVCKKKNMRTLKPGAECCEKEGVRFDRKLELKFGECTRKARFIVTVCRAYPKWNMARVGIKVSVANDGTCSPAFRKVEMEPQKFWVGSFDFPMVDHTYISSQEKYAVILDKVDRGERLIKLKLVYFPSSEAGLQEKSYYQTKLLERLISQSDLFGGKK